MPHIEYEMPGVENEVMDLAKKLILWFDRIEEQEMGYDAKQYLEPRTEFL